MRNNLGYEQKRKTYASNSVLTHFEAAKNARKEKLTLVIHSALTAHSAYYMNFVVVLYAVIYHL